MTLPVLWGQVQPGHFSVHSSSGAVTDGLKSLTLDPEEKERFELVLDFMLNLIS